MRIQEITWMAFEERSQEVTWGIIPIGAVEAYGPHLPLGTDGLIAERLAILLGEKLPGFVGPLIPVGYSSNFEKFPGTLTVAPHVLEEYVLEIGKSLINHDIKKLLFLNGHAGNVQPINYAMEQLERNHGAFCIQIDVWRFLRPLSDGIVSDVDQAIGHASELMTSIMLHFYPHLVHLSKVPKEIVPATKRKDGVHVVQKLDPQISIALSGNPAFATADKGAQLVVKAVDEMLALLKTL